MTEGKFMAKVLTLAARAGIPDAVCHFEKEDGKFIARLDGVLIIGNSVSSKVTVCFGSGHKAMAVI